MMQPTTHIREAQTESPHKARVEAELRALQNKHRLAIHIHEISSQDTREFIAQNDQKGMRAISQAIEANGASSVATPSMSLLPDTSSGASIRPYLMFPDATGLTGYLINLATTDTTPPRIVTIGEDINTGESPYHKEHKDASLCDSSNGIATAEKRLDDLARSYHSPERKNKEGIHYNEIVAAMVSKHIVAIVVPNYETQEDSKWVWPIIQLNASLEGLEHLANGVELLVVCYHVSGKNQGRCTYIAQGRAELLSAAVDSLKQIDANATARQLVNMDEHLKHRIKQYLNIDSNKPLSSQTTQMQLLQRACDDCGVGERTHA